MIRALRRLIQQYLSFSAREADAFLLLVPLTAAIVITPHVYKNHLISSGLSEDDLAANHQLLEDIKSQLKSPPVELTSATDKIINPVQFDPNTISEKEMMEMGLSKRVAGNVTNYRQKGGYFRVKGDLAKIYGLSPSAFETLYPFIDLPEKKDQPKKSIAPEVVIKEKEAKLIKDINLAEREELMQVRGVGEKLSQRIISFREGLGGFHSMDQLSEVYGLSNDVVAKLTARYKVNDTAAIRKIDLRTAGIKELARHPYINYQMARLIVAYREQHVIDKAVQLLDIKVMTDSLYQKIEPYITVGIK